MATRMTAVYTCKECGIEVTVNSSGFKSVEPIFCCGLPLYKTNKPSVKAAPIKKHKASPEKKADKKEPRKTSKKTARKPLKSKEVSR